MHVLMRGFRLCADRGKRSRHFRAKEVIKALANKIGSELGAAIADNALR